ncbi:MAG: GNAT family N-acetyltransferase, partial [Actinobacteria bacterium]|nr:GNAT family N-acetyltransferase [Actinomycetota bacterium]
MRAVTRDDAPAILTLMEASDRALIGQPDYGAEDLSDEWGRPRFELERDPFLLEATDGSLVAYAFLWESEPGRVVVSWCAVRPAEHSEEMERFLLAELERRARERLAVSDAGPKTLRFAVYESERVAAKVLPEAGFEPVRYFWRMAIALTGSEERPEPPPGITLDDFDKDRDGAAAHAAIAEAFADHWGTPTGPFEEWIQDMTGGEAFDPGLWVVARAGEEVAGVLAARMTAGRGWIAELGVRTGWRGRGVGAALLRESFARFAARGVR